MSGRSFARIVLAVTIVVVLGVAGLYACSRLAAQAAFRENLQRVDEIRQAIQPQHDRRPAADAGAEGKSADDCYEEATRLRDALSPREWDIVRALAIGSFVVPAAEDSEMDALMERTRPVVRLIREATAAHFYDANTVVRQATRVGQEYYAVHVADAVKIVLAHAVRRDSRGDSPGAIDLLFVAALAGQDVCRLGSARAISAGSGNTGVALEAMERLLAKAPRMPESVWTDLGARARTVEGSLATLDRAPQVEEMSIRLWFEWLRGEAWPGDSEPGLTDWYSPDVALARSLGSVPALVEKIRHGLALPGLEGDAFLSAEYERLLGGEDPIQQGAFAWSSILRRCAATVAIRARLLRVALAVLQFDARHERMPSRLSELLPLVAEDDLVCPYARTPLHFVPGRLWSDGGDGDDDGGVPYGEFLDFSHDGDVVWMLPPR